MLSEFDLIARFFTRAPQPGGPVRLGVGDDCALLAPAAGQELAISTDMLVEGRHFFADADAHALGHGMHPLQAHVDVFRVQLLAVRQPVVQVFHIPHIVAQRLVRPLACAALA